MIESDRCGSIAEPLLWAARKGADNELGFGTVKRYPIVYYFLILPMNGVLGIDSCWQKWDVQMSAGIAQLVTKSFKRVMQACWSS